MLKIPAATVSVREVYGGRRAQARVLGFRV